MNLFHFEQTDRIAHRMARNAAFRRPRPAPNYLPDANQIRNARDVSREKSLQVLQKVWRLGSVEMVVLEVGLNRQCCQKAKSRQILR